MSNLDEVPSGNQTDPLPTSMDILICLSQVRIHQHGVRRYFGPRLAPRCGTWTIEYYRKK